MSEPSTSTSRNASRKRAASKTRRVRVETDNAEVTAEDRDGVIVVEKRKKKRKRKYSRGTRGLQELSDGLTKASFRVPNAVAKGLDEFYDRSRKSSKKRRDGAFRDLLRNGARGADRFFRQFGKAPNDVARKVRTRRVWKQTRGLVSAAVWPLTGFGVFR